MSRICLLFYGSCSSLRYAPLIGGLTNVTNASSFHLGNTSLQYIPPYDLPSVNTFHSFATQSSIRKTVKFPNNLSNVTTIYRMYDACAQLEEAMDSSDGYDFTNVTSARECYDNCTRMAKPHTVDLPNCTSFKLSSMPTVDLLRKLQYLIQEVEQILQILCQELDSDHSLHLI